MLWPATTIDDGQWNGEKLGSPYLRIRRAPALSAPLFDVAPLRQLKAGAVLFAAGDTGDGCYRLEQGLLKVKVTSPSGEERIIAILGPGTIVGELAMIDRLPRSASVVALRDSVLRFASREAVREKRECASQNLPGAGGDPGLPVAAGRRGAGGFDLPDR